METSACVTEGGRLSRQGNSRRQFERKQEVKRNGKPTDHFLKLKLI